MACSKRQFRWRLDRQSEINANRSVISINLIFSEIIANQYTQTGVFTSNANHIVKQTENSPYIPLRGKADGAFRKNYTNQPKHGQNKRENRDIHERQTKTNSYMETPNVWMTEPSTSVLESEIDGGITRIRMNKRS